MKDNLPNNYPSVLQSLKDEIARSRTRARFAVNAELIELYWRIGKSIRDEQKAQGWGAKVIQQLSDDLRREFPEMTGLSSRNLHYMRQFAEAYPDQQFVQRPVAQIPWGHIISIISKASDESERDWYAAETIRQGWARSVLVHQIETGLYQRQGKAPSNLEVTLPASDSELAEQLFKDPYNLEFLDVGGHAKERALERALVDKLKDFMLELGKGFAFVGSQVPLKVGESEFYVDLLFYHLRLRSYVVIELKTTAFKPEYIGKLGFYLEVIDDQLRHLDDKPSIGLILCKDHEKVVAEYALRGSNRPMGVSRYELPKELQEALPTVEDLESRLSEGGTSKGNLNLD